MGHCGMPPPLDFQQFVFLAQFLAIQTITAMSCIKWLSWFCIDHIKTCLFFKNKKNQQICRFGNTVCVILCHCGAQLQLYPSWFVHGLLAPNLGDATELMCPRLCVFQRLIAFFPWPSADDADGIVITLSVEVTWTNNNDVSHIICVRFGL